VDDEKKDDAQERGESSELASAEPLNRRKSSCDAASDVMRAAYGADDGRRKATGIAAVAALMGRNSGMERLQQSFGGLSAIAAEAGRGVLAQRIGVYGGLAAAALGGNDWATAQRLGARNGLAAAAAITSNSMMTASGTGFTASAALATARLMSAQVFGSGSGLAAVAAAAGKDWTTYRARMLAGLETIRQRFPEWSSDEATERDIGSVEVAADGTVTLGGEVVTQAEIEQQVEAVEEGIERATSPENLFEWLVGFLKKTKPVIRYLVLYILIPYIITVYGNITTPTIKSWVDSTEIQMRMIFHEVDSILNIEDSGQWRTVVVGALGVYGIPNHNSRRIDMLTYGKPVLYIAKSKHWANIRYFDVSTGALRSGWVYLRYVKKP